MAQKHCAWFIRLDLLLVTESKWQRIKWHRIECMVVITFPDLATERRALGYLAGRFSGRVLKGGINFVPEAALESLARENIPFTVKGIVAG